MRELLEIFQYMGTFVLLPGGFVLHRTYLPENSLGTHICISTGRCDGDSVSGYDNIIDFLEFCGMTEEVELKLEELILLNV